MNSKSAPPFSLLGFDHVVFLVDDMRRAIDFYTHVLGCVHGYSYPAIGMEQLWCGNSLIVLWDVTHPGARKAVPPVVGGRNVDHLCIAIGPFEPAALKQHLQSFEVEIVNEGFHGGARGEGVAVYFHDPFGNKIELKGPAVYEDGRILERKNEK